jgi:hypothetical protein
VEKVQGAVVEVELDCAASEMVAVNVENLEFSQPVVERFLDGSSFL